MMTKVLLQTTIPYAEDDWNVDRFSLLRKELGDGVVARNREPDANGDDPVLSALADSDFDELWLLAVDPGNGLSPADVQGIMNFRRRGGGVLTARDHEDLGACLCTLGSLGRINHFHTRNPEPDRSRWKNDDRDNPNISYPNYHSGANGDYQPITPTEPVHEILRSDRAPNGVVAFFPAHPHEGAVGVEAGVPGRVIAVGRSVVTGRPFNLAVAVDDETDENGNRLGRAIAISSFHHLADVNWDVDYGCPSFVTDKPGHEIKDDPSRLEIFKDYVRNIVRWLAGKTAAYASSSNITSST